jgi:hypothetical protein
MDMQVYSSAISTKTLLSEVKRLFAHRDQHSGVVRQISLTMNAIDELLNERQSTSTDR